MNKNYLFDKNWFQKNQHKLLWLLNTPIVKIWFRWIMRIHKYDCSQRITEITPNSFSWGDRYFKKGRKWHMERTTDFRTHNKFSKRLYYAFYPLWYLFHCWDIVINFLKLPALDLGFATLTVYPDANPESTSVDGRVTRNVVGLSEPFATIRGGAGNEVSDIATTIEVQLYDGTTGVNWEVIDRSITLVDTSALGASASVSAATFSIFGSAKEDTMSQSVNVVKATPASNTALVASDYNIANWDMTQQSDSPITIAAYSIVAYNDFPLNATGIGNISKTGISKFGIAISADYTNTEPIITHPINAYATAYAADQLGTANDPKLVVTYTVPSKYLMMMGIG